MKQLLSALLIGLSFGSAAIAADLIEPPIIDAPEPMVQVEQAGGWYIRGDVDYGQLSTKGIDYDVLTGSASFDTAKLKGSFSAGAGIGYQINDYFRTDLTFTSHFKSNFTGSTSGFCPETPAGGGAPTFTASCVSSDISSASVYTLMANAYADLGTFSGFTPYVGAGIGGAQVKWGDLTNTATCTPTAGGAVCLPTVPYVHKGISEMRFAYALHAGVSYDLMANLKLDTGYTWTHVNSGEMFRFKGLANHIDDTGVMGRDRGINIHEVRVGLRYQFGGATHVAGNCCGGPVYK